MPVSVITYNENECGLVISLGEGDVSDMFLCPSFKKGEGRAIVSIIESKNCEYATGCNKVGDTFKPKEGTFVLDWKPIVILDFNSIKSIDVMIKALEMAKAGF